MNYLIDTCVISELRKPVPQKSVREWFQACKEESLHISSLSMGELYYGISILPEGKKKDDLLVWFDQLGNAFSGRIIPVTENIGIIWGVMRAKTQRIGRILPVIDGLLAATAEAHNLTFVTRNIDDVEMTGVQLLNPWQD